MKKRAPFVGQSLVLGFFLCLEGSIGIAQGKNSDQTPRESSASSPESSPESSMQPTPQASERGDTRESSSREEAAPDDKTEDQPKRDLQPTENNEINKRDDGDLEGRDRPEEVAPPKPAGESKSPYAARWKSKKNKSDFLAPMASLVLPGLDQWWEGQYTYGAIYSGVAIGGLAYAENARRNEHLIDRLAQKELARRKQGKDAPSALDERDFVYRKYLLGSMIRQGAGGFSAFHAFRSAAKARQHLGEYEFLATEESPLDLIKAPFRFQYLKRSSTYIPLAIGAAFAALRLGSAPPKGLEKNQLAGSDYFFTGAFSMNAGTHEEAVFRGWLMPFMTENFQSPFWANVSQSLLFALAHMNTVSIPLPQLLLGYHLGTVVTDDNWRLGEAVFIHVWWDVLAFASNYSYKEAPARIKALSQVPVFWLPTLEWVF